MKDLFIVVVLIAGLNIPVYLELYKHALKHRSMVWKISITATYWIMAVITQNFAAFIAVLYLYFAFYRFQEHDELIRKAKRWKISLTDPFVVLLVTLFAWALIVIINYIYMIILVKLVKYNIKPQDVITYYTQAHWTLKAFLAVDIVMIAPMVEEFVFRYFLYDRVFIPRMPKFTAAFIAAVLFAILHFNVGGIPTFLGLGLFCSLIYEKKGYWGAVIAHGVSNAITLLYL